MKKRLIISLSLIIVGMIAISQANSVLILFLFTLGIGAGSGMIFLASGVLLTDYFGRQPYLELFSVMNLISTVACFGPLLAGIIKDISGSFTTAFMLYACVPLVILLLAIVMKRPQQMNSPHTRVISE
ncbi:hypothetical protein LU604_05850 [Erwinia tracheiphila]|uniref:hypothetical protein n=1 Tax=Erwinia tracheiphila TaxID=65700 RepID=UPI001F19BD4D|nr:hypothetical protein [Erwinia tracheiphila]UIA84500.1 hypothetical protein LU604_05850 [Erwinia tracheiphila]UIA93093.1 hypothetical protein LU632_05835 [Erwinia tracheiphila]